MEAMTRLSTLNREEVISFREREGVEKRLPLLFSNFLAGEVRECLI